MRYPLMPPAAIALLLAACQPARPGKAELIYTCDDGRVVHASYPRNDQALLAIDGKPHRLDIARSASGARYVGDGWQWWTKGMRDAWLAPLSPGEAIASAPGVACTVR